MKGRVLILLIVLMLSSAVGCATIVSGTKSKVTVNTYPPARVVIKNRQGKEVEASTTPSQVELPRGFILPAHYTAVVEAPGYEPQKIDMKYTFNGWSIVNLLWLPGFIVDDATGAMFTPEHEMYSVNLRPNFQTTPGAYSAMPNLGTGAVPSGQQPVANRQVQQVAYQSAAPAGK